MLGIGKFGDGGAGYITPLKHLGQIHLGDAASGVAGVVVVIGVNDHAFQHAFHLLGHFIQQLI